jgi:hypothetical protein
MNWIVRKVQFYIVASHTVDVFWMSDGEGELLNFRGKCCALILYSELVSG